MIKQLGLFGGLLCLTIIASLVLLDHFYPMPKQTSFSSVVLADNGEVLRAFSNENQQWRYPLENSEIPKHYLELLFGYEDRWFYQHFGVNPLSILRASWQNIRQQRIVSGGSTLTMQVARLMSAHPRSFSGKLQQALRALQLEWHFSKAEILNLYLNLAPFGGTLIGVQAASISYFDKPLNQLTDAEAALLAVLPQAPSRWRPDRHPEAATFARNKVLKRMAQLKIWPQARVQDALQEPLFSLQPSTPLYAPLLARRLKKQCLDCEKIESLIDIEMQQQLEELVADYVSQLAPGLSIAMMVMENANGAVRSYIGSADFRDNSRFAHVDMVQAVRSPGSTLKPFLYALAIDRGLIHSQSLLQDTPRYKKAYRPLNFSGGFNGPVSVTQALQRSLNIPAVQVLEKLTPAYFAAKLENAGLKLSGEGAKNPNISMILGGVGTTLEHLLGVYSALARSGISIKPRLVKGQKETRRYLLSPGAAWISWKMLAVNPQRKHSINNLNDGWGLAWKTGTSYGFREAWAMGVSKKWTIGVWVGRPDGSASPGISGRHTAAPLLFKASRAIGANRQLIKPDSVSLSNICWPLGSRLIAMENTAGNCQQQKSAWILSSTVPPTLSDQPLLKTLWYNRKGQRVEPSCDSSALKLKTLAFWPIELEPWINAQRRRSSILGNIAEQCTQLISAQQPINITSIADESHYQYKSKGLHLEAVSQGGNGHKYWYLNGRFIGKQEHNSIQSINIKQPGQYQIAVVDSQGNADLVRFKVE